MHKVHVLLMIVLASLAMLTGFRGVAYVFAGTPASSVTAGSPVAEPAPGIFLVARRSLHGPVFGRSVVLLLNHDENGSRGLLVNREMSAKLSDVVSGFDNAEADKHRLFLGGPVGTHQVFMLLRNKKPLPGAQHVDADMYFSSDRRVLETMLAHKKPSNELQLYIGYSGWTAGQLDAEIERGSWELVKADARAVFDDGNQELWEQLIDQLEPIGIEVRFDRSQQMPHHGDRRSGS